MPQNAFELCTNRGHFYVARPSLKPFAILTIDPQGPDGSGGFAKGRGKPLAPPAGPVPGHPITQIGSPSSPINVSANEDSTQEGVESLAGKRRDEGSEVDEEEEEAGEDV